jgi:hypothetical protein
VALWVLNGRNTRWVEYLFQPGYILIGPEEKPEHLYCRSLVANRSLPVLNPMPELCKCTVCMP